MPLTAANGVTWRRHASSLPHPKTGSTDGATRLCPGQRWAESRQAALTQFPTTRPFRAKERQTGWGCCSALRITISSLRHLRPLLPIAHPNPFPHFFLLFPPPILLAAHHCTARVNHRQTASMSRLKLPLLTLHQSIYGHPTLDSSAVAQCNSRANTTVGVADRSGPILHVLPPHARCCHFNVLYVAPYSALNTARQSDEPVPNHRNYV